MIMLALALFQAASLPAPTPRAIGTQSLPVSGCAAYLWQTGGTPLLVAMATAEPGTLKLSIEGKPVTLSRVAASGEVHAGLAAHSDYAGEGIRAALDLVVATTPDLADGARVPSGSLQVAREGGDLAVVPLAGLIGCAPVKR